jgi:hypothetical protein
MPLITVSAGTPSIPAGTYPATLIAVARKHLTTSFTPPEGSDFLEWTWLVEGPEKDIEITSLTSLATGPKSTMFTYLCALLAPKVPVEGQGFEEGDLVGKRVMVNTIVTEAGWSKINTIVAAPVQRTPSANPVERVVAPAPSDDLSDLPF